MLPTVGTLVLDIFASWARLFAGLIASVIFSIFVGVIAATNKRAEKVLLPAIDILQTIPILGFFPVVIAVVVLVFGANIVGINFSVIFLIFTSMAWNITFGVYEAVKSIPEDFLNLARINRFSTKRLYRDLYIPAALPRIAYQINISWAVGLFYLVTSEIFSTGSANFAVTYGIGVAIANLVANPNVLYYALTLGFLVIAVLLTRLLFLSPLSVYAERYSFKGGGSGRDSTVLKFYEKAWGKLRKLARSSQDATKPLAKGKPGLSPEDPSEAAKKPAKVDPGLAAIILTILVLVAAIVLTNSYSYLPTLFSALASSFARVWFMYIVCALISVPLGIVLAKSAKAFEPSFAVLQVIASIPAPILLPVIVALLLALPFGNELVALSVIFLSMVWYILFSVMVGIRTIPKEFFELGDVLRFKKWKFWRDIYLPAVLPSFVTGSITAIGGAWNALIVAEYFSVQTCTNPQLSLATCPANELTTKVLSQVSSGVGVLLDQTTLSGALLHTFLVLLGMVLIVLVVNKFLWQRVYKAVTRRYRIDVEM